MPRPQLCPCCGCTSVQRLGCLLQCSHERGCWERAGNPSTFNGSFGDCYAAGWRPPASHLILYTAAQELILLVFAMEQRPPSVWGEDGWIGLCGTGAATEWRTQGLQLAPLSLYVVFTMRGHSRPRAVNMLQGVHRVCTARAVRCTCNLQVATVDRRQPVRLRKLAHEVCLQ